MTRARLRKPTARALYIGDLGLSSLSNVMVLLVAAHVGARSAFGAASLAVGLIALAINLRQAAFGDLVVVRTAQDPAHSCAGYAYVASFVWGAVAALCTAAAVSCVGGVHAGLLLVLVGVPLLFVQDATRYLAFARGRAGVAVAADGLWLVLQSATLAVFLLYSSVGVTGVIGIWVCAGAVSAVFAAVRLGVAPRFTGIVGWAHSERAFIGSATTQVLTSAGTTAVLVYGAGVFASAAAAGALRGTQTLLGPLNVVMVAERLRMTRHYAQTPGSARRDHEATKARVFVVVCIIGFAAALLSTPHDVGTAILGATWDYAYPLILPMSLQGLFLGLLLVPVASFTARVQLRKGMALRAVLGASSIACSMTFLTWMSAASAIAWGLAAASAISCLFGEWLMKRPAHGREGFGAAIRAALAHARGGGLYTQAVSQRVGAVIAALAARARLTPDALTTANLVVGLASSAVLLLPWAGWPFIILATLGWQLAYACDCADGQLARWKSRGSRHGKAYDVICDFAVQVLFVTVVLSAARVRSVSVAIPTAALFLLGTYFATVAEEYLPRRTAAPRSGPLRAVSHTALQVVGTCRDFGLITLTAGVALAVRPELAAGVLVVAAALNSLTAVLRFLPLVSFREGKPMTPDNVVILAAGLGSRLGPASVPKPLAELPDGQTILGRQLAAVADCFPAATVTIVVGHMRELVVNAAPTAAFVHNEDYATTNTAASLSLAFQQIAAGSVLWLNGDVVFDSTTLRIMNGADQGRHGSVCVVRKPTGDEEVKFVSSEDGYVLRISKVVEGGEGEAVGINFLTASGRALVQSALLACGPQDYFEAALDSLALDGSLRLRTTDVTSSFCMEIDTPHDMATALTYFSGPTASVPDLVPAQTAAGELACQPL